MVPMALQQNRKPAASLLEMHAEQFQLQFMQLSMSTVLATESGNSQGKRCIQLPVNSLGDRFQ